MTKRKAENLKLSSPVSESRDHIQGPLTAPVTLVEYGDYECPYCAQAYLITKEIQERLGDKLRFVFRNFPITKVRPHAYETALAAEAAAAQGKFWDMYDYLFRHGQAVSNDSLRRSAASLGLNLTSFDREFQGRVYSNHIDEDIQSGMKSGVKSTPTFFINGELYNGAWDLDSLLGALDEESVFSWSQANK
jgi:protein-disulfide isomerase